MQFQGVWNSHFVQLYLYIWKLIYNRSMKCIIMDAEWIQKCWYKGFEAAALLSFGRERRLPNNVGKALYYLWILLL